MTKKSKNSNDRAPFENENDHPQKEKHFDFSKSVEDADSPDVMENSADEKIALLEAGVAELKDKYLRLLADFENYKKRTTKERLELMNSASKDVIVALLPVLDDFDRARKSAMEGSKGEQWSEGVNMVYNRLYNILQSFGLKAMESTGQPFDPDLHEAITEVPASSPDMIGNVMDTIEKGYMLNDKIIRHAKVVVGN